MVEKIKSLNKFEFLILNMIKSEENRGFCEDVLLPIELN